MNRDPFVVDEPVGRRWDAALQFLREGAPVSCMGLILTVASERIPHPRTVGSLLKVRVQTRHDPRRLTYDQALQERANAEGGVEEIRDRSAGFAEFVSGRDVLYALIDDYGMGSVGSRTRMSMAFISRMLVESQSSDLAGLKARHRRLRGE